MTQSITHHCLMCGRVLVRYQDHPGEVPPVCQACGIRDAKVNVHWKSPGPIEVAAMKEQTYQDAYLERKAAA